MPITNVGGILTDAPSGQTVRFGSQLVTWSIAGQMIAEEFEITYTMADHDLQDESGKDNKAIYIPKKGRGRTVCQVKASTTACPTRGETASFVPNGGGAARTFMAVSEHQAFNQNNITKIPVDIVEVLNP